MTNFIQQLIQGLSIGSIYGLVALGYVLIYQTWRVLNFAQGDVAAIGAFALLVMHMECNLPIIIAFPLAVIISAAIGMAIEFLAFRPLVNANNTSRLIVTIGVSICIRNVLRLIFGADSFTFPSYFSDTPIDVGGVIIIPENVINMLIGFGLVVLLNIFLKKTRMGKALRATAQDREAARLMGINVTHSLSLAFILASVAGAVAGMLIAPVYLFNFNMGASIGTKGFAAAVLGGIEYASGAMAGGILLGVAECLAVALGKSSYQSAIAYIVLFLALIIKPSGIMGKKTKVEKV